MASDNQEQPIGVNSESVKQLADAREKITTQLSRVIIGQQDVIEELLISMFSQGHCLLEGVPGLAKTLLISTLADTLSLSFSRIQFTPDLMPADITGTEVLEENKSTGSRERRFLEGPIFSNMILADEINRTPPKTQAALLEAMQERQVTVGGVRHKLTQPFFVLATQNPIEQEGTYPLPEAQQDRFMFKIFVDYPNFDEEFEVARQTTAGPVDTVDSILSGEEIISLQQTVRQVPVSEHVIRYAVKLVTGSRPEATQDEFIKGNLRWGAGSRASQALILTAKARALLDGRLNVAIEDIQALAKPVLRHRLVTNFNAAANGIDAEKIIQHLLDTIQA